MPGVRACCDSIHPQAHEADCQSNEPVYQHLHAYGKDACPHPDCASATPPLTYYKIQRPDGKFSNGGSRPSFGVRGKTWHTLGALRNHINTVAKRPEGVAAYKGAVIHRFQMVQLPDPTPVSSEIEASAARRAAKEQERQARALDAKSKEEIATLKKLKEKYPNV